MYFQQNEAPSYYAKLVRDWLDASLLNRWIGRRGLLEWPSHSPDLSPPGFFLWGVLKEKVYSVKPHKIAELKKQNRAAIAQVPLELCVEVCCSVPERLAKCIELHGEHKKL